MDNNSGNNYIDYGSKAKTWSTLSIMLVIGFFIFGFAMQAGGDESSREYVLTVFVLMVLDVILFVISYSRFKVLDAKSKNMTMEEYNKFNKDEAVRMREELKESKTPKVNADGQVICPKCGSTNIQIVKRGWKATTGLIGSSKNERVCINCLKKF